MWNNKLLVHEEMEWISRREDLAALARDSEHGWFNGFVEDTLHAISHTMITVDQTFSIVSSLSLSVIRHRSSSFLGMRASD